MTDLLSETGLTRGLCRNGRDSQLLLEEEGGRKGDRGGREGGRKGREERKEVEKDRGNRGTKGRERRCSCYKY